jgi:hypothetical protein
MTLPPRHLVEDAVLHTVLPPFGTAAVVLAVGLVVFGRKAAPVAAAVGFVLAWVVVRLVDPSLWNLSPDRRADWIPPLAAAGALAGMLGRAVGAGWQAVLWAAVVALFAAKVCPEKYLKEPWWAAPAGAALVTAAGLVPAALARRNPGATVPFAVTLCLFATSVIVVLAHGKQLMDFAVVGAAALAGLSLVALFVRVDVGPALPGATIVLAGTLLTKYYEADDECKVPGASYLLPVVAPVLLGMTYLPVLSRLNGWKLLSLQLAIVTVPLAYAVWAATAEPLGDLENM